MLPLTWDSGRYSHILGVLMVTFIMWTLWTIRKKINFGLVVLIACLFTTISVSMLRIQIELIFPLGSGPRYFFFPFIMLSWFLLQLAAFVQPVKKNLIISFLVLCWSTNWQAFSRRHDFINWQNEVDNCVKSNNQYILPVHYAGEKKEMWSVHLLASDCKLLVANSWF